MQRRTFLIWGSDLSFLIGNYSGAQAPVSKLNPPAPPLNSTQGDSSALKIAVITATVTLAGIVLKDFIFKLLEERRTQHRSESAVYERYSKPLAASTTSLLFRLNEIVLQEHRPVYLKTVGIPLSVGQGSTFRAYKKLSTLYRLASLLGWIRACRREFSHVRLAPRTESSEIDKAITKFENALADGSWVERERVSRLCELWQICRADDLQKKPERLEAIGVKLDNTIYDHLEAVSIADLTNLQEPERETLSRSAAHLLTSELRTNAVEESMIQRTWQEAFSIISLREAWIYKDWQGALGDLMLREIKDENRKFEILGFGEFEHLCMSGDDSQKQWICRLSEVFDAVDFSIEDRFDARPRQLRTVAQATAELAKALHSAQGSQSIIDKSALKVADEILTRVV